MSLIQSAKLMTAAVCLVFAGLAAAPVSAEPQRLYSSMPGLYERVAVNPGTKLHEAPSGSEIGEPSAFSVYYVFDRRTSGGEVWLQVGPNASGDPEGWMVESGGTELRHLLILGPQTRQNRERALYFDSMDSLNAVAQDRNRVDTYLNYVELAANRDAAAAVAGIVGIQPENQASMQDAFGFMPIRQAENVFIPGLGQRNFYQTLSIPLPPEPSGETGFNTGVVFVVDTTASMGPYIEATRQLVRDMRDELAQQPGSEMMSFALVAYRDSIVARPGLDYVTKIVHPLELQFDATGFDGAISNLHEAQVSSQGFNEDALAGLTEALRMDGWDSFQRGVVVLVTDAGMRDETDPLSDTGLALAVIAREAEEKNVSIVSMYLATPEGEETRRYARGQHREVSRWLNGQPAFVEIEDGDIANFSSTTSTMNMFLANLVDAPDDCSRPRQLSDADQLLCELQSRTNALRIEWVARREAIPAEAVASGWVSDVSLDSTRASAQSMAFKPYLLLTRNQLDDLILVLEDLLETAAGDIDSNREAVLQVFQNALSRGAVDPQLLEAVQGGAGNADLFQDDSRMAELLPAFLAELPLRSPFMNLEVSSWINPQEQAVHMLEIRRKLTEYRDYLNDRDRWVALADGAREDEFVYPIPWDRIP